MIAKNTISDMLKNMERITVAELVKRTGLSRGFFYKNEHELPLDKLRVLHLIKYLHR